MEILNFDEKIIANYIESIRPPAELRKSVDLGYSFSEKEVILFEIRSSSDETNQLIHYPFVKAKFVKVHQNWKIYRMRGAGKWELYEPNPTVRDLAEFVDTVEEDELGYFRG